MAHSQLLESHMGRETDYIDRTIDDHIDQFEALGVI
jgi:hypothetical protein